MNHITGGGGGFNTQHAAHRRAVLSELRARVQIEIDTRFLPRLLSILAGIAPCCHPINRISDRKSAAALSLIKNISTRLRTNAFKAAGESSTFPLQRDLSLRAPGILFLLPANSVSAADRKSHPMQQRADISPASSRQWNLLPLGLLGGGTQ